jgi:DNA-directed RNA polymerase specialized sigma24 family protein
MIELPMSPPATTNDGDRLHDLVVRIATGDRVAFRDLYGFLAMRVWRDTVRMLPLAADARAVTRSTFVEVWHLAGHHVGDSGHRTRAWIAQVTARHLDDRLRTSDTPAVLRADYDRHTHLELASLLGSPPPARRHLDGPY